MAKSNAAAEAAALTCGLVMPISAMDGCTAEHWVEVKNIICDAVQGIEDRPLDRIDHWSSETNLPPRDECIPRAGP